MGRAVRVEYAGALYHVMSRGVERKRVFLDSGDREALLEIVGTVCESGDLEVHAFCLMPNHYHLLCSTPRGELSRWMHRINGDYAQRFNLRHRRVGYLWQGRYKAILVEKGNYLVECSRYIHLNPNRARLTRPAERWKWSSYRNYVGGPAVVDWVVTKAVLSHFGGSRKKYREYVEAGKGEKQVSPFERAIAGLVLGGEAFVKGVRERVAGREETREVPSLGRLRRWGKVSPEKIEAEVAKVFAAETERRRGRLRLYALRRYSGLRGVEIARRFGRGETAVSEAVRAVESAALQDGALARNLAQLGDRLSNNG